jgi:hypothetical protein
LRRALSADDYPSQAQEWENWKREAAAGAFQENGVLQGRLLVQFKARTGGNKDSRRQRQGRGDKIVFFLGIQQKKPSNCHSSVKM